MLKRAEFSALFCLVTFFRCNFRPMQKMKLFFTSVLLGLIAPVFHATAQDGNKSFELGVTGGFFWNLSGDLNTVTVHASSFGKAAGGNVYSNMASLLGGNFSFVDTTVSVKATSLKQFGVRIAKYIGEDLQLDLAVTGNWGYNTGEVYTSLQKAAGSNPDTVLVGMEGKAANTDITIGIRKFIVGTIMQPFFAGNLTVGYSSNNVSGVYYQGNKMDYTQSENHYRGGLGIGLGFRFNFGETVYAEISENVRYMIATHSHSGLVSHANIGLGIKF